jgi:preprotein translocase subunit SecY
VIPPIFASSIILFPATLAGWFGSNEGMTWLRDISGKLSPGQPIYVLLYASAIVFFCFFYTALVFNPKETAENLKKGGAFVPGIRPGEQTAKYIEKIIMRLTLVGAIYVTLVCLLPEFLIVKWNVPFYFGGTRCDHRGMTTISAQGGLRDAPVREPAQESNFGRMSDPLAEKRQEERSRCRADSRTLPTFA